MLYALEKDLCVLSQITQRPAFAGWETDHAVIWLLSEHCVAGVEVFELGALDRDRLLRTQTQAVRPCLLREGEPVLTSVVATQGDGLHVRLIDARNGDLLAQY